MSDGEETAVKTQPEQAETNDAAGNLAGGDGDSNGDGNGDGEVTTAVSTDEAGAATGTEETTTTVADEEVEMTDMKAAKSTSSTLKPEPETDASGKRPSVIPSTSGSSMESRHQRTQSESRIDVEKMKIAQWLIEKPCWVIVIIIACIIFTTFISSLVFEIGGAANHSYYVLSSKKVHRMDAFRLSQDYIAERSASNPQVKTQNIDHFTFSLMWRKRNGETILNEDDMNFIISMENEFLNWDREGYFKSCLADPDSSPDCSEFAIVSPFRYVTNGSETITDEEIQFVIDTSKSSTTLLSCFSEDFAQTNESRWYRGFLRFGLPYPDISINESSYNTATDDFDAQEEKFKDWAYPAFKRLQYRWKNRIRKAGLELVVLSGTIYFQVFDDTLNESVAFVVFSIVVVWLMMMYHLRSFFLATISILQICAGFPIAFFVYRFVFWVTYFDSMSTLIIFVILGIGADDVFVFMDAWEQSLIFVRNPDDLVERMSFAFTRASKAMLVTQLTTFFAFLGTTISQIVPIQAFGIWAGTIVIVNYALVISFFPACLSFWDQYLKEYEHKYVCFVCDYFGMCEENSELASAVKDKQQMDQELEAAATAATADSDRVVGYNDLNSNNGMNEGTPTVASSMSTPVSASTPPVPSEKPGGQIERRFSTVGAQQFYEEMQNGRRVERFLGIEFVDFIMKARYVFLTVYLAFFIVAAVFALQIEGEDGEEEWFNEGHFMTKCRDWPSEYFGGSLNDLMRIHFVWGVKDRVDRSGTTRWDTENYGEVQFIDDFDMSSNASQWHIYQVCQTVKTWSEVYDSTNPETFHCFMEPFRQWGETEKNLTFPFILDANNAANQKELFTSLIGEWATTDPIGQLYWAEAEVGYVKREDGSENLYVVSIFFSINDVYYVDVSRRNKLYRLFQRRIKDINAEAEEDEESEGVSRAFQTDELGYAWAVTAKAFEVGARSGIFLAMPLAFIVLLFSTSNWIVTLFATSTIILILATEVALMVWQGWKLGIGESVAVVIMIGFSVDYVVHLGNAYVECEFSGRRIDRLRFSLFTMGISVIFGGLTTAGSGVFLMLPVMLLFQKFGILIMSTVAFSLLFALTYFTSILAVLGPENDTGYVPIWPWINENITLPMKELCCNKDSSVLGQLEKEEQAERENEKKSADYHE